MRRQTWLVAAACASVLLSAQVAAQVTVEALPGRKGKSTDTFSVKAGSASPLEISLLRVKDYPAQKMRKACQDPLFQGLQVQGTWHQAVLRPGPGAVVAVYDRAQKLERMGFPAFPLASVQGPGWHVTVHWVTTIQVRAISRCQDEDSYDWWHIDLGGAEKNRQGLLLDVITAEGRAWYFIEKCGDDPATVRRLEAPGSEQDLTCPSGK